MGWKQPATRVIQSAVELEKVTSISQFARLDPQQLDHARHFLESLLELTGDTEAAKPAELADQRIYQRNAAVKGPMHAFDYSYIDDKLGVEASAKLALQGPMAYEALNLVDGKRTVSEIRNWLVAEFAPAIYPIRLDDVAAFLSALESIGVILWKGN